MKTSTIKHVLNNKLEKWFNSIEDLPLRKKVQEDTIVAGGCIASLLMGESANDFDIYFRSIETAEAVARYYVKVFNDTKGSLKTTAIASCNPEVKREPRVNIKGETEDRVVIFIKSAGVAGETQSEYHYFEAMPEAAAEGFISSLAPEEQASEDFLKKPLETAEEMREDLRNTKEKKPFRPVFLSQNAITLSDKVQVVIRFAGEPNKILDNYDFAHCMSYYDYFNKHLEVPYQAMESLLTKTLIYKGSLYPVCSLFRIRKFLDRGFRITAGQMLKIIWQLQSVNLNDRKVFIEQLIGVDSAYMGQLISALSNTETKIDGTYLAKLIDEIFE